jgi:quercetin dioxygenase-like cupin family protein
MKTTNLKDLRALVRANTNEDNAKKKIALDKIHSILSFNNNKLVSISFDELKLFKIGERVSVNDEIDFEKTYEDDNKQVFLTYLEKGGAFGIHSHDCYEFCKVLKGNLIEKTRGLKSYGANEISIYAPNEKHTPYATENSVYEVIFLKEVR